MGREVIIQGLVDSVTHSPIEVRIVGVEPLRVKVRGVWWEILYLNIYKVMKWRWIWLVN